MTGRNAGRADLLLLFSGVTEARHFPYLSLPQLTAFCRGRGYDARQRDLNIELSLALLQPQALVRRLSFGNLSNVHTAVLGHLLEEPPYAEVPADVVTRIRLNGIDVMLEESVLVGRAQNLADVVRLSAQPARDHDVAAAVHDALVKQAVTDARPRVVGFSVAFFSQLIPTLRAARIVRETLPDAVVVLGGQQVMLRKEELKRVPGFGDLVDELVDTAGETAIPALLDSARATAPALAQSSPTWRFRDNPAPVFDGLPFDDYFADLPQLPVLSCIGCYWGRCTFCSYGNRSLREGYQQLDHRGLADVVCDGLVATSAHRVTFVDENSNLMVLLRAMELVRARGYDVTWSTRNRMEPALTDASTCRRLAAAGCVLMSVGYETHSQRVLDELDKGVDASTYQAIIDNLDAVGVALRLSVLGGVPGETAIEAAESTHFLVVNADKVGIDVAQMLIVEPGTALAAAQTVTDVESDEWPDLVDNTGFSYLGGRVGRSADYGEGPEREERASWLGALVGAVLPGKNDEQHPRFRNAGPVREVSSLLLNQWIVEAADGSGRLIDVRWKLIYKPVRGTVRHGRVLGATDRASATALGLLAAADVGTPSGTGSAAEVNL